MLVDGLVLDAKGILLLSSKVKKGSVLLRAFEYSVYTDPLGPPLSECRVGSGVGQEYAFLTSSQVVSVLRCMDYIYNHKDPEQWFSTLAAHENHMEEFATDSDSDFIGLEWDPDADVFKIPL